MLLQTPLSNKILSAFAAGVQGSDFAKEHSAVGHAKEAGQILHRSGGV